MLNCIRTISQHISQDNLSIYRRIISAISMSLTYRLTKTGQNIPLASDQLLDIGTPCKQQFRTKRHSSLPPNLLSSISINIQWLPSGTILISTHPLDISARCSIAELQDQNPESLEEYLTEPLKLSPIGKLAGYRGDVSRRLSPRLKRTESLVQNGTLVDPNCEAWKASLTGLLRCYGLEIDATTRWVQVQVFEHIALGGKTSGEFIQQHNIIWPAHLCFVKCDDVPHSGADFSWAWDHGDEEAADPLTDAETWFLEKAEREQALEAYYKRKEKEAQKRLPSPSDDGDSMLNLFPASQKHIDQQTASGVYPTPPDGFRNQPIGQPSDLGRDSKDRVDAEGPLSVKNEEQTVGSVFQSEHVSPDVAMDVNDFHRLDGDDLFGDMNTDMFTAHGLTEDDFDFFDQPADPEPASHGTETAVTLPPEDIPVKSPDLQRASAQEVFGPDIDMLMDEPSIYDTDIQNSGQTEGQQSFNRTYNFNDRICQS